MANAADVLKIIQLINALLGTASALGLSWDRLREQISRAQAEGRDFNADDLRAVLDDAEAALARLRAALDAQPGVG